MSFNDLTQNEKRSLLTSVFAMNKACKIIAQLVGKKPTEVSYGMSLDGASVVMQLSDKQVNEIIEKIQQAEVDGKPCIMSFENTANN